MAEWQSRLVIASENSCRTTKRKRRCLRTTQLEETITERRGETNARESPTNARERLESSEFFSNNNSRVSTVYRNLIFSRSILSSPEPSKSPSPFTPSANNYTSASSTPSEPSSTRSYLRLNKSNQSTPRSTPKSPSSPPSADSVKRSFFRFNSSSASSAAAGSNSPSAAILASSNTNMGQTGSNVKRSQSDIQTFLDREKERFVEKIESPIRQNARLEDFDLIRTIGTGSFGECLDREWEDRERRWTLR